MAWLAVDKEGTDIIYSDKPTRDKYGWNIYLDDETGICLPSGSIRKLIGRDLTWDDEAVEI